METTVLTFLDLPLEDEPPVFLKVDNDGWPKEPISMVDSAGFSVGVSVFGSSGKTTDEVSGIVVGGISVEVAGGWLLLEGRLLTINYFFQK